MDHHSQTPLVMGEVVVIISGVTVAVSAEDIGEATIGIHVAEETGAVAVEEDFVAIIN